MAIVDTTKARGDTSYLGNPHCKRDGVEEDWTQEKVGEYAKCMADPAYFACTHLKVINLNDGLVPFDLYPLSGEDVRALQRQSFLYRSCLSSVR
jgi:hypothetical protein